MFFEHTPRRRFLAGLSALTGVGLFSGAESGEAQPNDHDRWLDRPTAPHRQFFDFNAHGDGIGLIHMHNFIETHKAAYGVMERDINVVGSFYGGTTPLAWNDMVWAKYKIGQALNLTDPATKAPLTRNWFYQPKSGDPVFFNGVLAAASIDSLVKRGATFLMCNNAFRLWVGRLAGMGFGKAEEIEPEIRANLVPGVVTVPAMVIAVNRAQRKGLTYIRT
ncbi:MAG: hypothetical protein FJ206_13685 [Gemmatimonadetes bacterium]|nr:hypothetical protein [Gemmatimonadota bacterium]